MNRLLLRSVSWITLTAFFFAFNVAPVLAARTYNYDANGNMTSNGENCYEYNDANQVKSVKNCASNQMIAEYVYDYQGNRIVKKAYANGSLQSTTFSPDDEYEYKKFPNNTDQETTYYKANDQVIAQKKPNGSIVYYHNDHLGSSSILTDQQGNMIEKTTYEPYGEVKSGGTQTKFQYTGQEKDDETGLNYYGARYYDPHIHRFTQPDTIVQNPYNPQALNRYSYVINNPLRYTDPTGNIVWMPFVIAAVRLAPVIMSAAPVLTAYFSNTYQEVKKAPTPVAKAWIVAGAVADITPQGRGLKSGGQIAQTIVKNSPKAQEAVKVTQKAITQTVHGNNMNSLKQTWGYTLRRISNPEDIVKYGETTNLTSRYSVKEIKEAGLFLQKEKVFNNKADARVWEHESIGEYLEINGEFPTMNYQAQKAVNVFR